jgi:hypothetical protein
MARRELAEPPENSACLNDVSFGEVVDGWYTNVTGDSAMQIRQSHQNHTSMASSTAIGRSFLLPPTPTPQDESSDSPRTVLRRIDPETGSISEPLLQKKGSQTSSPRNRSALSIRQDSELGANESVTSGSTPVKPQIRSTPSECPSRSRSSAERTSRLSRVTSQKGGSARSRGDIDKRGDVCSVKRSNSSGTMLSNMLSKPPRALLTSRDGRTKSLCNPLEAAMMESIIGSVDVELHRRSTQPSTPEMTAERSGKGGDANDEEQNASGYDQYEDQPISPKTVLPSAEIPPSADVFTAKHFIIEPAQQFKAVEKRPAYVRSERSYRKDPNIGIHCEITGSQDRYPVKWSVKDDQWCIEQPDTRVSSRAATPTLDAAVANTAARRLNRMKSDECLRGGNAFQRKTRSRIPPSSHVVQQALPSRHAASLAMQRRALGAPAPAPLRALPPIPAKRSSLEHPGRRAETGSPGMPRRKQVPGSVSRTNSGQSGSPQKRKRQAISPQASSIELADRFSVNRTPPLRSPGRGYVDLEVLEVHVHELQYRTSQLSAMVIDLLNSGVNIGPAGSHANTGAA